MKLFKFLILLMFLVTACKAQPDLKAFPEDALNDVFTDLQGADVTLKSVLKLYEGKTIFIDVWASWCRDCIKGMPKVKALQKKYTDVAYVFLSLDKTPESWKIGIQNYQVKGHHYFLNSGWKGAFGKAIDLDWIPRYMVINPQGEITVFKAIKADDDAIITHLK